MIQQIFERQSRIQNLNQIIELVKQKDPYNGYQYVDLGLPSGIKWTNMNVGATSESDYGLFFQWGDTVGYTQTQVENGEKVFSWSDYKWCDGSASTITKYNSIDGKRVLDTEDDGVRVHMGGDWRLPTGTNIEELTAHTNYEYTTIGGVTGGKFTNKSDSSKYIFLPDVCYNDSLRLGTGTLSWSSSLESSIGAYYLCGRSSSSYSDNDVIRSIGLPLRGVVG